MRVRVFGIEDYLVVKKFLCYYVLNVLVLIIDM